MPITEITRDQGVNVAIVRLTTTDTLADVITANYVLDEEANITQANGGAWTWLPSDIVLCYASDGHGIFTFTNDTFTTLEYYVPPGGGGGVTAQQIQDQSFIYGTTVTTGANIYTLSLTPPLTSYQAGQIISFTADSSNTNTVDGQFATLDVDGLGAVNLMVNTLETSTPLYGSGIVSGGIYHALYDGTNFIVLNPSLAVMGNDLTNQFWTYSNDNGALNAYAITVPILVLDGANPFVGTKVCMKAGTTNTGNATLNVNGSGAKDITTNTSELTGGEIIANRIYEFIFNNGDWILLNPTPVTPLNIQEGAFIYGETTNVGNDYSLTLDPPTEILASGHYVFFKASATNTNTTTNATLNVDGNGAAPLFVNTLESVAPLYAGGIVVGNVYMAMYESGSWRVVNPSNMVTGEHMVAQTWSYAVDSSVVADTIVIGIPVLQLSGL